MIAGLIAPPGYAALREGDRGSKVREVQQRLKNWGYYKGNVDGIFGPKTTAAVKYFQRKNNLTVDGIVGKQTFAALGISSNAGKSSYSSDINLLARMIAAEGRGETYLGQIAIGAVIMNRVKHPSFPNTIAGVLYQPGAFTAINDGQFYNTHVPDSCRRAAVEAYNGYDPTYGSIYYYNPAKATSSYIYSRPVVTRIGSHVFCK
jgi:N-acetylmuramoyl-L-alanine amidase